MKYITKNKKNNKQPRTAGEKKIKTMDPALLQVRPAMQESAGFEATLAFSDMPVHQLLKQNIQNKGYRYPTEIQERAIPALLKGADIIGIAATGTGKTGAFLIPFIEQLLHNKNRTGLVVVPTRELAQQVAEEFKALTTGMKFRAACFIGGTNVNADIARAGAKNHLIIATPGRLLDLVNRKALHLNAIEVLILDEFDRMLDMGFINDVTTIASLTRARRQTLLFSATINASQQTLIRQLVQDPLTINVSSGKSASSTVEQNVLEVAPNENKMEVLFNLLSGDSFEKVMLFAETKRTVDNINKQLARRGVRSDVIHGNKSQHYRTKAIQQFKTGHTRVLIATDVASRGLDVQNVTHVINYQLPQTMEAYIHRIGRTGRAGKKGIAYTFIN
ncbi:DEAD/DEAH box helicase [Niabella yanshanensis]|uniref:DEAD/DEAH box helicase n=1 Tax=Niabella yanshanensis TaxID=577386 RepID=A0ABZ0W9Z5_9BACT|nr:DEAD/DEAH box helicase [Niabella yanshanensis]WQD39403.1 DEAD/DEAH box helicase [Niabella yanshanensis]